MKKQEAIAEDTLVKTDKHNTKLLVPLIEIMTQANQHYSQEINSYKEKIKKLEKEIQENEKIIFAYKQNQNFRNDIINTTNGNNSIANVTNNEKVASNTSTNAAIIENAETINFGTKG